MPLTPKDIQSKQFEQRLRGVDHEEVAKFLKQVAGEFNTALQANQKLEEQIEALNEEINGIQNKEKEFHSAMLSMHKSSEELKKKSEEEAKGLVEAAKEEAKTTRETAQQEATELQEKTKQETDELLNKTNHDVEELREEVQLEAETLKENTHREADTLIADTITETDEQREAASKETQELLEKTEQEVATMKRDTEREIGAIQERNRSEKERLEKDLADLKHLRETVNSQMREFLECHLERLDAIVDSDDSEIEREAAAISTPLPTLQAAPSQPEPEAAKPTATEPATQTQETKTNGGLDDLTSRPAATNGVDSEKDLTAMDVDDLTGLYEKIDISDLGAPNSAEDQGSDDLLSDEDQDLSMDSDSGIIEDLS